ncbi:MAG: hypothetical protein Q8O67_23815 [Deltaproteobacteria bacterium]|nr:hypothetical protein [Deltaproteobacteria bacterium]
MSLTVDQAELWQRVAAFDVDGPAIESRAGALSFVARLARENGWGLAHAERVVVEYRRFVFLAVASGHAVTPSEQVDQAWHLHLVYTRSYWDELCAGVLRRPLHHGPTKGGPDEGERFDGQYRATLASYARLFDDDAPADIWPAPEVRFGSELRWRRVWTDHAWVIAKGPARALLAFVGALGVVVALLA